MQKRFALSTLVASGLICLSFSPALNLAVYAADATVVTSTPLIQNVTVAATTVVEKKSRWTNVARNATDALDRNDGMSFIVDVDDENLDIFARALNAQLFKDAQDLPVPRGSLPNRFAMQALVADDRVGCTEAADKYATLLTTDPGSNGFTNLLYMIRTLEASGRKVEASRLRAGAASEIQSQSKVPQFVRNNDGQIVADVAHTRGLTKDCLDAIASGDKDLSLKSSDILLQSYRSQPDLKDPRRFTLRRQNLFCSILNVARKFSDLGWYQESDLLLGKLQQASQAKSDWSVANGFISIEQGINSQRQAVPGKSAVGKSTTRPDLDVHFREALTKLQFTQHAAPRASDATPPKITAYDYTDSEKFRRLAVAYYWAGELDRAALLINCAFSAYNEVDEQATGVETVHYLQDGLRGDNILLNLDAACLAARQSKFDQANKYMTEVLSGPPLVNPSYGAKIAELASLYEKSQRLDEAVSFLQAIRDKKLVAPDRQPRSYQSGPFLVDYWLARLLFADKKIAKAREIIDGAVDQISSIANPPFRAPGGLRNPLPLPTAPRPDRRTENHSDFAYGPAVLAGNCAYALQDYKAAALHYEEAGMARRYSALPVSDEPNLNRYWLQKSIDCFKQAPSIAAEDRSRILSELATIVKNQEPRRAFDLNKSAAELLDDSNPKKSALLAEMGQLQQLIERAAALASSAETPPTVASSNEGQLVLLRKAALLSEQNNEPLAASRFYALAQVEARSSLLDKAKEDYLHAISLHKKGGGLGENRSANGLVGSNDEVIRALLDKDRMADAIAIFQAAMLKLESSDGAKSPLLAGQCLDFMQFYIDRRDDKSALNCLDKFLACDMHNIEENGEFVSAHGYRTPSIKAPCDWARSVAVKNPKLATTILNKILASQLKQLNDDDYKLVETMVAFGDIQYAIGQDSQAIVSYKKAFDIYKLYNGEERADKWITQDYLSVLRKTGNTAEFNRLDAIKKLHYQPQKNVQRPRREKQVLDLNECMADYNRFKDDAPYGNDARRALQMVISVARSQQKWATAIDYSLKQIALSKHLGDKQRLTSSYERTLVDLYIQSANLDEARKYLDKLAEAKVLTVRELSSEQTRILQAYIRSGQLTTADTYIAQLWKSPSIDAGALFSITDELIQALVKADKKAEAKSVLHKLFEYRNRWMNSFEPFYIGLSIAKLAVDFGETKFLPQLLSRVEVILPKDQGNFYLIQIADLWKKIGDEKHSRALREKFKTSLPAQNSHQALRQMLLDPERGKLSREQVKVGQDFPAAPAPVSYSFNFAALAGNSLTFEQNARLSSLPINLTPAAMVENHLAGLAFAGSYGKLTAVQNANHSGELSFIAGSSPGTAQNVIPMPHGPSGGVGGGGPIRLIDLPTVLPTPFKPALKPPTEGVCGQVGGMTGSGLKIGLGAGDYKCSGLGLDALYAQNAGRLRIFLEDSNVGNTPVFHAQPGSLINAKSPAGPAPDGCTLELWYDGSGTIKLDRDSTFNGLIYAPNARVEIGPGQANFCGAIVAKDILVSGESRVFYDPTLAKWKQEQ